MPSEVRCVVLGGGGHAKVLLESLQANHVHIEGLLDQDQRLWRQPLGGVPILGDDHLLPELIRRGVTHFVVGLGGVGDNRPRQRLFALALAQGLTPLTVIHPAAICSPSASLGAGCVVFAGGIVNPGAALGEHVIVNTGAIVEHNVVIGDHAHVASGATLCGGVQVGALAHIGAGATVRQGLTIGEGAIVGAGAVVIDEVEPWSVVVGVPARELSVPTSNSG